jgi:hypothetical protein
VYGPACWKRRINGTFWIDSLPPPCASALPLKRVSLTTPFEAEVGVLPFRATTTSWRAISVRIERFLGAAAEATLMEALVLNRLPREGPTKY